MGGTWTRSSRVGGKRVDGRVRFSEMSLMKASACLCEVRGLPRERNSYLLERARSDQTLSDASSAPRVHVRPIYDDGGLRRISHGVRRMDKNVRRVWNHRVDV